MTQRGPNLLPAAPPATNGPPDRSDFDIDETLSLAEPKTFTRGFLILCGIVTGILYLLVHEMGTALDMPLPWLIWLAPLAVLLLILGIRRLLMPPQPRTIRFHSDYVELPRGRNSRRTYDIPYAEIRTIVPLVSRGQPALVIQGPRKTHVYLAGDFQHQQNWRVLWAQLMDRISRRPDAAAQLRRMRRLSNLSQNASSTKPRFTRHLLWGIAAIFAAQLLLSPDVDVLEFLYFGANSQVMVLQEGQWWRVVTANLLHGNALHFGVNAFALYFLGTYCERLFGQGRTIVLTLATALGGATASLLGTEAMFAVGISTALFGLLGAYFALHLRFGRQLPPPYRQSWLWWGVILGLNAALSIGVPMIDAWGHFGGFVAGVVIAWAMTAGQDRFEPRHPSGIWTNLFAAGLIALFAACTVIAIGYAVGDHPEDELTFAQALQQRADTEEPALLAQVSHQWSQHTPRPTQLDPVLVSIAEAAHEHGEDMFTQWRAAASIVRIAEQVDDPFDQSMMQTAVTRFESTAVQFDDRSARQALARLLADYTGVAGPLHAAESPFEGAEFVNDGVRLAPEAELQQPRRVYLLAFEPQEDRGGVAHQMLDRCVPAGGDTGFEVAPVEPPISTGRILDIAMIAPADVCPRDRAAVWRATEVTEPSEPQE